MWKKVLLLMFFVLNAALSGFAENATDIEIYDIEQKQIVKRIANTEKIQLEIKSYLDSIKRTVPPFNEAPSKGKMVRIPLNPPVKVENQWVNTTLHEIFMIMVPDHPTFIIIYDENKQPYLLQSDYVPKALMELLAQ